MRKLFCQLLVAAVALLAMPGVSFAMFVVSSQVVNATPGSTGFVEVTLTNNFLDAKTLSGFSLEVDLAPSGVTFTGVDETTSTAPYVFGAEGFGLLSFDLFPNTHFEANDLSGSMDGFVTLAAGQTVGLLRAAFSVAGGAADGLREISFVPGVTSEFVDGVNFDSYADTDIQFQNGGINVQGGAAAVPEPTSLSLFAMSSFGLAYLARRRRLTQG